MDSRIGRSQSPGSTMQPDQKAENEKEADPPAFSKPAAPERRLPKKPSFINLTLNRPLSKRRRAIWNEVKPEGLREEKSRKQNGLESTPLSDKASTLANDEQFLVSPGVSVRKLEWVDKKKEPVGHSSGGCSEGFMIDSSPVSEGSDRQGKGFPERVYVKVARGVKTPTLMNEWRVFEKLTEKKEHSGIVQCLGVKMTGQEVRLFLKGCSGGSLADSIQKLRTIKEVISLLSGVADAVRHIHQCGITHYDLHAGNVLLDEAGQPVLADFAVKIPESDPVNNSV